MIDTKELRRLALDGDLAAITELLDRLETAESARRDDYQNWMTALDRNAELLAKLEAAEKERDELRATVRHEADCVDAAKAEIETLQAKVEEMKQQEQVAHVWLQRAARMAALGRKLREPDWCFESIREMQRELCALEEAAIAAAPKPESES